MWFSQWLLGSGTVAAILAAIGLRRLAHQLETLRMLVLCCLVFFAPAIFRAGVAAVVEVHADGMMSLIQPVIDELQSQLTPAITASTTTVP